MMTEQIHVLLVEDNLDDAVLFLRELRGLDYAVTSERVDTLEGMRQALLDKTWDLIVSDYSLMNFTAIDALETLQETGIDTPFIIISGRIGEETAVEVMRAGAHDFLIKRNLTRLGAIIERELREAESRRKRKLTEEALRQSEDRFARAFAASPIPSVIFRLHHAQVLDANQRFYDLLGYEAAAVIGTDISQLAMWINPADFVVIHKQLEDGRSVQDYECSFYTQARVICYVLLSAERIEVSGQPAVLAMFYDITERKLAENRLRHLQTITASLSEALTPQAVAEVVIDAVPRALNAAAAMVVSIGSREGGRVIEVIKSLGYGEPMLRLWQTLDINSQNNLLATAIIDHVPLFLNEDTDQQYPEIWEHSGSYCSTAIIPLVGDKRVLGAIVLAFNEAQSFDAEMMQYIMAMGDQSAQAMQRAQLYTYEQKARLAAEEANQLKVQFLGMISHELRTPLASIKGYTSTLMAKDVSWSSEDQDEFISTIDDETDKLTDLVNQLLDMSRLQAGHMSISPQELELRGILDGAMPEIRTITREHQLSMEIPADLPPVYADQHRIGQVITNLIENAARYSPPDTRITLSAGVQDGFLQMNVDDEGVGLSQQDVERVFEPFQQINRKMGFRQGTGLGLTICKGLVEAHNGTIWIDSREGAGTRVSFTIPLVMVDSLP